MEIILSKQCESLQGSLGRGFGYFIVRRGKRFFSQRSRHSVPSDGHWRFILTCAVLAQNKLHITDIRVHWIELYDALFEAYLFDASYRVGWDGREKRRIYYDASDIINLKTMFGL